MNFLFSHTDWSRAIVLEIVHKRKEGVGVLGRQTIEEPTGCGKISSETNVRCMLV